MSEKYQAPTTGRYSAEFKERAVRMVRQLREETGERRGTIGRVGGCAWLTSSALVRGRLTVLVLTHRGRHRLGREHLHLATRR